MAALAATNRQVLKDLVGEEGVLCSDRCKDNYAELSGTSMATAVVSGAVALMLEAEPGLSPATIKARLMRSARKESGKFSEGVILSKSMEVLFRAVPPSLYLAMAMTEPEEKAERYQLMREHGISELEAAFKVAEKIDQARGIEPLPPDSFG